jgi:hypothetical protein
MSCLLCCWYSHPQDEYGLFALLILVAGTLWIYAYRIYAINNYTLQARRVLVAEFWYFYLLHFM